MKLTANLWKLAVDALLVASTLGEMITIPNVQSTGPVKAEAISKKGALDWAKLAPGAANITSYDW
jgi:hypothetical protein